jgi:hypothetical protein
MPATRSLLIVTKKLTQSSVFPFREKSEGQRPALVLGLASGVTNARAAGWPVAAGVAGGFVAGAVITRAVADCPAPGYTFIRNGFSWHLAAPATAVTFVKLFI